MPKGRKIMVSIIGAALIAVTISFTMGFLLAKTPESLLKGALCISLVIFVIAFPVFLLLLGVFGRGKVSRPASPAQRAKPPTAVKPAEDSLWVQSADYSAKEFHRTDAGESFHVYQVQDWARELERMQELQAQGQDCCPPGMGLVGADGRLLHICPDGKGHAAVLYRPAGTLLSAASTFHELPESDVPAAITAFHAGDDGWFREHLRT